MGRSYSANSIIVLPRLTAITAARLLRELLAAAEAEPRKLPAPIAVLRDALPPAYTALEAELAKRFDGEDAVVHAADVVEDNAFAVPPRAPDRLNFRPCRRGSL